MQIEIAIEGPEHALTRLCHALDRAVPEIPYSLRGWNGPRPGIVMLEDEKDADRTLLAVARVAKTLEGTSMPHGGFEFRVRNLAYSEPCIPRHAEVFRPIPALKVRPWQPGEAPAPEPGVLMMGPGNAFGTGTHPSSRLCLAAMDRAARGGYPGLAWKGCHVLDFGCGTGLLAMAAVVFGAGRALGIEIDGPSAETAKKNLALNRLEHRVFIRQGSWEEVQGKYDMILANLVPSVLLRTGKHIPGHLKPGGRAVIAGFGRDQMDAMEGFFTASGLISSERETLEGWGLLVMARGKV